MMSELIDEASITEILGMLGLLAGMAFGLMLPIVWIADKIVALKKLPDSRALWTVGVGYMIASIAFVFGFGEMIPFWVAPLIPLPATAVIFLWLRYIYRASWIDDDAITPDTKLHNDDWAVGLVFVLAVIAVAFVKVLLFRS